MNIKNAESAEDVFETSPIDELETLIKDNDWTYKRIGSEEIRAEITGQWASYQLVFFWHEDEEILDLECDLGLKTTLEKQHEALRLCAQVNREIALGHMDLELEQGSLYYRYTGLHAGHEDVSSEHLAELINFVVFDLDRFYPAFMILLKNNISAQQALEVALIDPVGEA